MKSNVKVGSIVEIKFLDHSSGDGDIKPVEAILWGKVQENNEAYLVICVWEAPDEDRMNWDSYAVLKSAILEVKKLK